MNIKTFGVVAVVGVSMNAWAVSKHLVYYSTFDDAAAITSPVVGEAGTKSSGSFVAGVVGNALKVPAFTQAVKVPFPKGLTAGQGCIEFYGRIDSGRTEFYDLGDPAFFCFHSESGGEMIQLQYTANNGGGNSGLSINMPGYPAMATHSGWSSAMAYSSVIGSADLAAWHHYAISWNTNGIESIAGRPALALLFDGNVLYTQPVSAVSPKGHVNGMSAIRYLSMTINTPNRGRSPYSIDEFKVWDTDVPVEDKTLVIRPESGTTFDTSLTVSMACDEADAIIRYTTDGSEPPIDSTQYTRKFKIYSMTTIKAAAFFSDGSVGNTVVAVYAKGHCATPVITAQSQFTGSKQKVEIDCATEGAIVRYATNGKDPNSHSTKYTGPFYVTDSTTIKAYATKPDYTSSEVATRTIVKVWGIGDTLGKPDHAFSTSGNEGFVRVDDATATLGESMKSGPVDDMQKSILSTTVIGPGTLTFKWKASCEQDDEYEWDHGEFKVDGKLKGQINGVTDWTEVSQRITGDGEHTLTWTYVKDDVELVEQDCIWVSDYAWKSDYTTTQTTDVPVPYAWLREKSHDIVDEYDNYEKVAKQSAHNPRYTVEQCYVAGLNPESATNEFAAFIDMSSGVPIVTWDPDLKNERDYKIWGKTALDSTDNWTSPTNAQHRFFKVTVEMK